VVPLTIYGGALAFMGGSAQTYTDGAIVTKVWMQNAAFIWVPFILVATVASAWGQNNIRGAKATFGEQIGIFQRKHAWILAWLYTGTFGSFIGFAAAFPQLMSTLFPASELKHWAFVGPLLGALVRPLGGWLSDRLGGAKVTFWNFAVMLLAAIAILALLPSDKSGAEAWFFTAFILLFITTGIGNGSVFHVVPNVFLKLHAREAEGKDKAAQDRARAEGEIEASVALGFTAGIAALGLFFIPALIGISINVTGTAGTALAVFVVFYVTCLLTTWWWYRRKGAEVQCD
jgi:NNP family nitrate/nitrite transporter-like MFS transporter